MSWTPASIEYRGDKLMISVTLVRQKLHGLLVTNIKRNLAELNFICEIITSALGSSLAHITIETELARIWHESRNERCSSKVFDTPSQSLTKALTYKAQYTNAKMLDGDCYDR